MRALALAMGVMSCSGCGFVGYSPPCPSVVHLTPAPRDGRTGGKTVDFGFCLVQWDTLQSGYGAAGWGYGAREHEGYWFLFNDYSASRPGEERRLLITPIRPPGGPPCVYKLQMIVQHGLLEKAGGRPGRDEMLEGTLTRGPINVGGRLEFDLENVPMTARPPGAGRYTLSGRIVAAAGTPADFESLLRHFNEARLQREAQK